MAYADSSPSPKSTASIIEVWWVLSIRSSPNKQSLLRIISLFSFPSFPGTSSARGIHLKHADTHSGSLAATTDKTKAGNHLTETTSTENLSLYRESKVHFQPITMKISNFSSYGIDFRHTTQLSIHHHQNWSRHCRQCTFQYRTTQRSPSSCRDTPHPRTHTYMHVAWTSAEPGGLHPPAKNHSKKITLPRGKTLTPPPVPFHPLQLWPCPPANPGASFHQDVNPTVPPQKLAPLLQALLCPKS